MLRVQSPEGTKRIEISTTASLQELYASVHDVFQLDGYNFTIYTERNYQNELASSKSQNIDGLSLNHGDMIFMKMSTPSTPVSFDQFQCFFLNSEIIRKDLICSFQLVEAFQPQPSTSSSTSSISSFGGSSRPSSSSSSSKKPSIDVQSDEVDLTLAKSDGRLERKRDPKLCRHNSNGCCVHCSPVEPFDEEYLKEHKIKHLSFHSYIRKLTSGVDRGKFVALEDLVCSFAPLVE